MKKADAVSGDGELVEPRHDGDMLDLGARAPNDATSDSIPRKMRGFEHRGSFEARHAGSW